MNRLKQFLNKNYLTFCYFFISIIIIFIPIKILSYGYYPVGEAMKYCAFAESNKQWGDILVIDKNNEANLISGWSIILKKIKQTGLDKYDLLDFSVFSIFLIFNLITYFFIKDILSWNTALLIEGIFIENFIITITSGVPVIITTICILSLYYVYREELKLKSITKFIFALIITSIAIWIHESCHLLLIIPITFILSRNNKDFINIFLAISIGFILNAISFGSIKDYFYYHYSLIQKIFTEQLPSWFHSIEFQPMFPTYNWLIPLIIIIIINSNFVNIKTFFKNYFSEILFLLIMWTLSIEKRYYWDVFGSIMFMYIVANLLKNIYSKLANEIRIKYLLLFFISISTYLTYTHDANGRYSKIVLETIPINFKQTGLESWAPGNNGLVYSDSRIIFYTHFFEYPKANWKYILGHNPVLMKNDDQLIYKNIKYSRLPKDFIPWVNKMTEKDRLILYNKYFPEMTDIEWIQGSKNFIIGRKIVKRTENR